MFPPRLGPALTGKIEVRDEQFVWGRIYTELVRDAGGIDAQIARMAKG